MSFYFTLPTTKDIELLEILERLSDPAVTYKNDEEGVFVFYKLGASLRGVMCYQLSNGVDIGIDDFPSRFDAMLTREITAAVASLLDCPVQPEDRDTPISAADAAEYGGDLWLNRRCQESPFFDDGEPDLIDAPTILFGYRRPFGVTMALVKKYEAQNMSTADSFDMIKQDAIALQCLEETENVVVPQITKVPSARSRTLNDFFRRMFAKEKQPKETIRAIHLTENVPTLIPLLTLQDQAPQIAILGSDRFSYRTISYNLLIETARNSGAREYCYGSYVMTLTYDAYQALYWKGMRW